MATNTTGPTAAEIAEMRQMIAVWNNDTEPTYTIAGSDPLRYLATALDALDRERRILHTLASTIESKSTDFASGHCVMLVGPITLADYDEWLAIAALVDVTP